MLAIKKVSSVPQQTLGLWEKDTVFLLMEDAGLKIFVSSSDGTVLKSSVSPDDLADALAGLGGGGGGDPDALLKSVGGTVSGDVLFSGDVKHSGKQSVVAVDLGGIFDIDCSQGTFFKKTVAGDTTFVLTNVPAFDEVYGLCLMVYFEWGAISFPGNVYFPNDTPLDLSAGKYHLFVMVTDNGGNTWRAAVNSNYAA